MFPDFFGARACAGCSCRILRATNGGKYQTHCRGLRQTGMNELFLSVLIYTLDLILVILSDHLYRILNLLQFISSQLYSFLPQLYRTVYLSFVTRIERSLMEKLAQDLVNSNSVSMVSKIYDQYLDVIALEPSLFTLNVKDSFMLYNEPSLSETQIR